MINEHFDFFTPLKNEYCIGIGISSKNAMMIMYDPDTTQIYLTCFLQSPKSFWSRFMNAIGYVTKAFRPRGGEYDHFVIEKEDIPTIRAYMRKIEEA